MPSTPFCTACSQSLDTTEASSCPRCGRSRPAPGWPSDALLGHEVAGGQYRVVRRLGSGGFGVVYEVHTTLGGLSRALKVLGRHWANEEDILQRFVNEAVILDRLDHPNVARCHAVGRLEHAGEPYLLLELVRGDKLSRVVKSAPDGRFSPERAVHLAGQIAHALASAHALNLLHRDLSPDNVLVANAGATGETAKIIDFGVAKILGMGASGRTASIVGTHEYMAPEQYTPGASLDARLDLWQLGALLFYMLTGQPPYRAAADQGPLGVYLQQDARRGVPGPAPREVRPELGAWPNLDRLVSDLLATDPALRPASASEVLDRLGLAGGAATVATTTRHAVDVAALCHTPSAEAWRQLCEYLDGLAPVEVERQVARLEHLLLSWPDEIRIAPHAWWRDARTGTPGVAWRLVRSLDLSRQRLDDDAARAIAAHPAMAQLTRLDLSENNIGNEGVMALAASPSLSNLRHLDLSANEIGSAGARALADSDVLGRLESLHLAHNGVGAKGAIALASAAGLGALRALDLEGNGLGSEGTIALANARGLPRLEKLSLRSDRIGVTGARALAQSPLLGRLTSLDLRHAELGEEGARLVAWSDQARGLTELYLGQNGLGPEAAAEVMGSSRLSSLELLDLSHNPLGPAGALQIALSPLYSRLRALLVADAGLGDAGLAALVTAPGLATLERLDVGSNAIGDAGVRVLAASPHAGRLATLRLSHNALGKDGAELLAAASRLRGLRTLEVEGCQLGTAGLAALLGSASLRLERLEAADNGAGGQALSAAASHSALGSLRFLGLAHNAIGREGAYLLASAAALAEVRALDLTHCDLGEDGLKVLAGSSYLGSVQELRLGRNGLGPEAVRALAAAPALRPRRLDLSGNPVGDEGARALAGASALRPLTELVIADAGIGERGVAELASSAALRGLVSFDVRYNAPHKAALPDLAVLELRKIELLESSFALVSARAADFTERFYRELFARHPEVKPLFARTNMRRQQQHLMTALSLIVQHLRSPDLLDDTLKALGHRHVGYGVVPQAYRLVTGTLLDVMRELGGSAWTPEVHDAWATAMQGVAAKMIRGAAVEALRAA